MEALSNADNQYNIGYVPLAGISDHNKIINDILHDPITTDV